MIKKNPEQLSKKYKKDLQLKIDMYDIIIEYLESVIRMINTRSYQIKNAIEWKSFIEGIR